MTTKSPSDSPILVTGAAGDLGAIGRNLTGLLLAKGHKVRALVRREDERAEAGVVPYLRSVPAPHVLPDGGAELGHGGDGRALEQLLLLHHLGLP
jgi:uncharacterized protein YbjT (DUF2867 family)